MSAFFRNSNIVITGASAGIGREIARQTARDGAQLTVVARNADKLQETAAEMEALGGRVLAVPADVTDPPGVAAMVKQALDHMGRIDMLINSAGIMITGSAAAADEASLRANMEVNFFGTVNCIRAVLPDMLERRAGHIVNVASVAAFMYFPGSGAYSASKFALRGYSEALAAEVRAHGIKLTVAYPGITETGMLAGHLPSFQRSLVYRISQQPVEKIARAVLRAVRMGRREAILTLPERLFVAIHTLSPRLTGILTERLGGGSPPPNSDQP